MDELPKGIRIDRGYVQIRIFHNGVAHCENFGPQSALSVELAESRLKEIRKQILLFKAKLLDKHPFDQPEKINRKKFSDVALLYLNLWPKETTPDGKLKHPEQSAYITAHAIKANIIPYFGSMWFDEIRPKDILNWREKKLKEGISGTTINRLQIILSSIFTHAEDWIKIEKIKPFKLPVDSQTGKLYNPCSSVERAPTVKRERVVAPYEISKLKWAARELGDENGRDNISLMVKTCLSKKDIKKLKFGDTVDLLRSKTGVPVLIPITVTHHPNWTNWRKRWIRIREKAGILDIEERDLRKAGGNLLLGRHDIKLVSQYMGHASQKTTEQFYTKIQEEKMRTLAEDLSNIVDSL